MAAPTATTVVLENQSGDTAILVSSTYEGAPSVIKSGEQPVVFDQNTELNTYGSVMYAIGKIATWIVVWTANNQVATWILPAGTSAVWTDIWNKIQPDNANDSYTTSYGWMYESDAHIKSNGDAQDLTAGISVIPPN
ncbi:uncharacterized protein LOC120151062 [Hibiscus syriacus]|uniref:uncharacterized protein LOC120151062 n=1 Tax=Hibiscus syriacus TaxID=106335 RepID=UPI0019231260|nr:uncharacterized protein LOC120151062 [Hibiscus syriacus]